MSTSMFKMGSFEAELARSMSEQLKNNRMEKRAEVDHNIRIVQSAKVVDCLHTAATLLDRLGHSVEAEAITTILERVANDTHKMHSHEKDVPEVFEIATLLHDVPKISDTDLGEQIVEIHSLPKKKV